jgi:S-adenosylmethionine decarboxylase
MNLEQIQENNIKMQTLLESPLKKETVTHEARGFHLLLTLKGCDTDILNDQNKLEELTRAAALATGATVLDICAHKFKPQGVTALAVLAESHASLHTYPESNVVFWDCFTCGTDCLPELSVPILVAALKPDFYSKEIIYRH